MLGGNAGTRTQLSRGNRFTGGFGVSTVNIPAGVIDGTCTHFNEGHGLAPRLLRPRPQSTRKELNLRLSLIGRLHDRRATRGKIRRVTWPDSIQRLSHHTAARSSRGESGEARRQRIERCCPGFGIHGHPRWRRMLVPVEGFAPSPTNFADSCPIYGSLA